MNHTFSFLQGFFSEIALKISRSNIKMPDKWFEKHHQMLDVGKRPQKIC